MKNILLVISIIGTLASGKMAMTQNVTVDHPQVRASVNPGKATVGVPLEYRLVIAGKSLKGITVRMPEKNVFFPDPEALDAASKKVKDKDADDRSEKVPLYVIHGAKKDESVDGGISHLTVTVGLSYFRPGKYTLPEIEILDTENVKAGYRLPVVEIESVNQQGEFQDIEPPLDLGGNYWRLAWLILGLAVFIAGVFYLVRYIERRRSSVPPPAVNPLGDFLSGVGALSRKRLIEKGLVRDYVFEMSALFRRFLSTLLGIDAMDMTVRELYRAFEERLPAAVFKKNEDDIRDVLDLWDLAKFAEFAPAEETLIRNMETTIRLAKNLAGAARHDVA